MIKSNIIALLLFLAPFQAALAQSAPNMGTAGSFAVLGGPAVTLTGSMIRGNAGVTTGGIVTNTGSTIIGSTDLHADGAYSDFLAAYSALAVAPCNQTLTGTLSGVNLAPGVYCFDAAATLTGQLTLVGPPSGIWIFKIGNLGTGALTGTGFSVVMAGGGQPCNVYWWVSQAATLTASNFQGTILAGAAITVTGGTFNGNALAKAAVTLTGADIAGCSFPGGPIPPIPNNFGAIKVTGGGQIPVPDPNSAGRATFGFNAQPDKKGGAKGHFNYVNHQTGLHINGQVDKIVVIAINLDGSPKTVLFSGTWEGGSFFVTVEDHGEPGTGDALGVTVALATGELLEVRSQRTISKGNIQFHK